MAKKKVTFQTSYGKLVKDKPSPVDTVSITVPDQSYTIKELLEKHTGGIYPEGIEQTPLSPENVLDELNKPDFDLSDISDLQEKNKELLERLKEMEHEHGKKEYIKEGNLPVNEDFEKESGDLDYIKELPEKLQEDIKAFYESKK